MVRLLPWPQVIIVAILTFVSLHPAEAACQRNDEIECRNKEKCISRNLICNQRRECSDGSDEDSTICNLWPSKTGNCQYNPPSVVYYAHSCRTPYYVCMRNDKDAYIKPKLCELLLQPKLGMEKAGMNMSSEVIGLLRSAVNSTHNYKLPDCPMLYTRFGNHCISIFTYAKVSWAEARQFCISIYGDLWHLNDITSYVNFLEYMKEKKLTSSFWIGGRYDIDTNAWSWVSNDSAMPLGAPFWAIKHESTCVARGPPHTNPYSDPPPALPGASCYNYIMSPKQRTSGWCSAMTYEYFHYWSEEKCDEAFSPLCIYTGPASLH